MGLLISIWCWIVLLYSRIVGPKPDVEPTRKWFAKIGVHFDDTK